MSSTVTPSTRMFAAVWTNHRNGGEAEDAVHRHILGCENGIRTKGDPSQRPCARHTGSARVNGGVDAELVPRGFGEGGS